MEGWGECGMRKRPSGSESVWDEYGDNGACAPLKCQGPCRVCGGVGSDTYACLLRAAVGYCLYVCNRERNRHLQFLSPEMTEDSSVGRAVDCRML